MASLFSWLFSAPFTPKTDIPPLDGKVIIVTGGNAGLGKAQLEHYAAAGVKAKVYLAARNKTKAEDAIKDIKKQSPSFDVHFLQLDLSSLDSVKTAAESFKKDNARLDILVNNAGIMAHPPYLTKDGYEAQFGTNHVGHFLFTRLLSPLLLKTAAEPNSDVRIVNLSSDGHRAAPQGGFLPGDVKTDMASYNTIRRYGQSKLANILFTTELARRYPQITSVAIHPGGVATNLADEFKKNHPLLGVAITPLFLLFATPPAKGAYNQTWATVADVEGKPATGTKSTTKLVQGAYYTPVAKTGGDSAYAKDAGLAKKLWEWSEDEMRTKGYLTAED